MTKLKEEIKEVDCLNCGKRMKRVAPYTYACVCNPDMLLSFA